MVLVAAALAWATRALQVYRWPGLLGVTAGSTWWRALVGASLVVAVGLLVAASRKELPDRLGRAFGSGASGPVAALAWVAVLSVATDAWFHGSWALLNVNGLRSQHENARMGLLVERSTRPGAHIADFSAGATLLLPNGIRVRRGSALVDRAALPCALAARPAAVIASRSCDRSRPSRATPSCCPAG